MPHTPAVDMYMHVDMYMCMPHTQVCECHKSGAELGHVVQSGALSHSASSIAAASSIVPAVFTRRTFCVTVRFALVEGRDTYSTRSVRSRCLCPHCSAVACARAREACVRGWAVEVDWAHGMRHVACGPQLHVWQPCGGRHDAHAQMLRCAQLRTHGHTHDRGSLTGVALASDASEPARPSLSL